MHAARNVVLNPCEDLDAAERPEARRGIQFDGACSAAKRPEGVRGKPLGYPHLSTVVHLSGR